MVPRTSTTGVPVIPSSRVADRPGASGDRSADRWERWTSILAQACVLFAGLDHFFMNGISIPLLLAVVLLPVWWRAVRCYQLSVWVVLLAAVALLWGAVMAFNTSMDHQVDLKSAQSFAGVLLGGVATMAFVLWARRSVPLHRVVLLYGIGTMAKTLAFGGTTWKFDLAVPVTLLVLGVAGRWSNRAVSAGLIVLLGLVGVVNDSRSYFAFCVLAALLTAWQIVTSTDRAERVPVGVRRWTPLLLLMALGVVIYLGLSSLLTSGALGEELQARSVDQIESSGSLIAGGRPEWAATRELLRLKPGGYGLGVVPGWSDLEAGRAGFASINVDGSGYVEHYLLGTSFELHSGLSDLWVSCGVAGVALGVLVVFALCRNLSSLLAARSAETVVAFFVPVALWSMLFGPLFTDWRMISLALGLSMLPHAAQLRQGRSVGHRVATTAIR